MLPKSKGLSLRNLNAKADGARSMLLESAPNVKKSAYFPKKRKVKEEMMEKGQTKLKCFFSLSRSQQ